uniref:Uncharacterized protein n=1 Tax=Rhizophora mucronata TaxID=61149 RepID=A0A2P2N2Y9_RHIMU
MLIQVMLVWLNLFQVLRT